MNMELKSVEQVVKAVLDKEAFEKDKYNYHGDILIGITNQNFHQYNHYSILVKICWVFIDLKWMVFSIDKLLKNHENKIRIELGLKTIE